MDKLIHHRKPVKDLNIGDEFWEVQNGVAYPRWAHTASHIVYCMKHLGETTFLTKEDAIEAGYETW